MNKKILLNLLVIALVALVSAGGTYAWSAMKKQTTANTYSTGAVSIKISNDDDHWADSWVLDDMMPCESKEIAFDIENDANQPLNLYKTIELTAWNNLPVNEAECLDETGVWSGSECSGNTEKKDLENVINYELSVKVPCPIENPNCGDPAGDGWWQTIYSADDKTKLGAIDGTPMFLGVIPAKGKMEVRQSYELDCQAANAYQEDTLNFTIQIQGEQMIDEQTVNLVQKVKDGEQWVIVGGGEQSALKYNPKGKSFTYNVSGTVPLASKEYALIYYADPWPGTAGMLVGTATSASDKSISMSGEADTGNLPAAGDANVGIGAKFWLVTASDYDAATHQMKEWNPDNYLFETALVNFEEN